MSTIIRKGSRTIIDYPTSDGRPMAETDQHRDLMYDLIKTLQAYYAADPMVYVSGNLLLFYEPGNRRRHISPDVFVVKGVPKRERLNYLVWEEGKGPDVTIELTSSSTRHEDRETKFRRYQDVLRVKEYFLFDPLGDYLKPSLQGYRLRGGEYRPMRAVQGRLPSRVLGMHLDRHGRELRLYDPTQNRWLPTPQEHLAQTEQARQQAQTEIERLQRERAFPQERLVRAEAEIERLRHELEELRRRLE